MFLLILSRVQDQAKKSWNSFVHHNFGDWNASPSGVFAAFQMWFLNYHPTKLQQGYFVARRDVKKYLSEKHGASEHRTGRLSWSLSTPPPGAWWCKSRRCGHGRRLFCLWAAHQHHIPQKHQHPTKQNTKKV